MLTKSDLSQIKKVVDKGVESRIEPLKDDMDILKSNLRVVRMDTSSIKKRVSSTESSVKTLESDTAKIRKDTGAIVEFFDHEYLELRKRVTRIEEHLGLPPLGA